MILLSCLRERVAGSGGSVLSTSGSTNGEFIDAMLTRCRGGTLPSENVVVGDKVERCEIYSSCGSEVKNAKN